MAIDLELALRAMDDDRQLLEQLANIFSEDAPRIATEFQEALSRQNSQSARMAIHSLKGLTASFYDHQTVEVFSAFERSCAEENWLSLQGAPAVVIARIGSIIEDMFHFGLLSRTSK